jgi:hypothetical protein
MYSPFSHDQMMQMVEETFGEIKRLKTAGNAEYEDGKANALSYFDELGRDLDIPREKVLWILSKKHVKGILAHIRGHKSQREPVEGRIHDLIVYLIILKGMLQADRINKPIAPAKINAAMPVEDIVRMAGGSSGFAPQNYTPSKSFAP